MMFSERKENTLIYSFFHFYQQQQYIRKESIKRWKEKQRYAKENDTLRANCSNVLIMRHLHPSYTASLLRI